MLQQIKILLLKSKNSEENVILYHYFFGFLNWISRNQYIIELNVRFFPCFWNSAGKAARFQGLLFLSSVAEVRVDLVPDLVLHSTLRFLRAPPIFPGWENWEKIDGWESQPFIWQQPFRFGFPKKSDFPTIFGLEILRSPSGKTLGRISDIFGQS